MKGLKVYNTLTRRKDPFHPINPGRVGMFVCGPTVQGPVHLGHARTYLFFDVVARYLIHLGLKVDFLINVTDIDERISTAAREEHIDPESLASRNSRLFQEDLVALGISTVSKIEPVSRHVGDAIEEVSLLIKQGRAYAVGGWVYFDTSTFPRFGRLSRQSKRELALRPLELSQVKRHLADFSLWRPEVLVEGKWASPWGTGSPGWHIQDTAITLTHFGPQYDIHGGAYDLIYPHHEAEIAQGESVTGASPLVRYWIHTHLVTMAGEKMSKSVGNVFTVREALRKYSPDVLRLYFLSTHYRKDMDLSGLAATVKRLQTLRAKAAKLGAPMKNPPQEMVEELLTPFYSAMNDDFATPAAIRSIERVLDEGLTGKDPVRVAAARSAVKRAFGVLGVNIVG